MAALPSWLRDVDQGVEIAIYVQPGARATEVSGEHDGALKLRIHAPPVDGKANAAVVAFFALRLDVARASISLISGDKSRRKQLRILGVSAEFVRTKLLAAKF